MLLRQKPSLILALILLLMMTATPAQAQGIDGLPATASEGVAAILAMIGAVLAGGTLGNILTDMVKRLEMPFLGQAEAVRLGGLLTEIAALLISTGAGWLALNWLTPAANWLDQSGVWAVAVAAWPIARTWFEVRKQRAV